MDYKKLEQLEHWATFFEFLSNPDEYKVLIEEAKQAAQAHREASLVAKGVKDVDEYRTKVEDALQNKQNSLLSQKEALDKQVIQVQKDWEAREQLLQEKEADIRSRQEVMKLREQAFKDLEVKQADVAKQEADLKDFQTSVRNREDAFNKQKAKLDAALRGQ